MPHVEIVTLGWQPLGFTVQAHPAFGVAVSADLYAGIILLAGVKRPITAVALGTNRIIGMALLQAWQLCIDIEAPDQGEFRLQPL